MRGAQKSFYHYMVKEKTGKIHYFKTAEEIQREYNICRTTLYHKCRGNHNKRMRENTIFEKVKIPIL